MWSSSALSLLPDLVVRLQRCVEALVQDSVPICAVLKSVIDPGLSLVSVFNKPVPMLVAHYSAHLSKGASCSLESCLKVAYRALLADKQKSSHHRSRFSIQVRSYNSWLSLAPFNRRGGEGRRLGSVGNRSVLTSKARESQNLRELTTTVGTLTKEVAVVTSLKGEIGRLQAEVNKLKGSRKAEALQAGKLLSEVKRQRRIVQELCGEVKRLQTANKYLAARIGNVGSTPQWRDVERSPEQLVASPTAISAAAPPKLQDRVSMSQPRSQSLL